MNIRIHRDLYEFRKISQFGRRIGLWKVFLVIGGGHDVAIGRHHIRFVGRISAARPISSGRVWDLDRKMWYRPLFWMFGEWRIWERGSVRYKYGFGKPTNVMTGPHETSIA